MPLTILVVLVGWLIPPPAAVSLPPHTPAPAWRQAVPHWVGHATPAPFSGEIVRAVEDRENDDDDDRGNHPCDAIIAATRTDDPALIRVRARCLLAPRRPSADRAPILRC